MKWIQDNLMEQLRRGLNGYSKQLFIKKTFDFDHAEIYWL